MIIAEGIPPGKDEDIINWYTEMFKLKENRRTFTRDLLVSYFKKNGFKNVIVHKYKMRRFNINNWLINSGIDKAKQDRIMNMHLRANKKIKSAYNMKIENGTCFVDTDNLIIIGEKE